MIKGFKMPKSPFVVALLAAALFGAATPASKVLLETVAPFQLAGFLYLGAAIGVLPLIVREGTFSWPLTLDRKTALRLAGAVSFGGVMGPVFLLFGLTLASSASVSLWLNLELIATVLLGHLFFRDQLTHFGWLAAGGIFAAATLLSVYEGHAGVTAGALVAVACLCWGVDNHLTALIDGITPAQTTLWKGLVAGSVNLAIGTVSGSSTTPVSLAVFGLAVGMFSYGISIVLYIVSAQRLGATRSQIVFSSSPFFGVILAATFLGERISAAQIAATLLMVISLVFLFFEQHLHLHHHDALIHKHWHRHDDGHHNHVSPKAYPGLWHTHSHEHESTKHKHAHWPDQDHRHKHRREQ
jgi:drug/metabolite transporter (DMT)-like permease